jgi:iron complex outermembrane receptor protein
MKPVLRFGGMVAHQSGMLVLLCMSVALGAAGPEAPAPEATAPDNGRTDIGTVRATGGPSAAPLFMPGSAPALAPSQPPLEAAQPTSVIDKNYIDNAVPQTEGYDNIIKFSPSVQNVEPTGAGLQQNFMETIRGFNYKQFNSTFDGLVLPGTISSFAPQTGVYFLSHDIASVSVDRGPGTASQIGYATFGGTVAATLVSPSNTFGVNPYFTAGSWGTNLEGLRLDTGILPGLGGARGMLDSEHVEGAGYLSGTSTLRNNFYGRIEAPIGPNTVITVVGMYDYARTHTPAGATIQAINMFGPNFALNYDPKSQSYTEFNTDNYYTDFDYIGIKSSFDGWGIDDKLYTVSYYHNNVVGKDPGDFAPGASPNLSGSIFINGVKTAVTNDVPGYVSHSDFRSVGNSFRLTKDTDWGQARMGLWLDYNSGSSYKVNVDLSQAGYKPYTKSATATPYVSLYNTTLGTVQPYVEFAAKPLPGLTITPGFKYTYVTRGLDATFLGSTQANAPTNQSWGAFLPAIDVHYEIMKGWVAYAQAAEGFLAPPINALTSVTTASANSSLKPQTTVNYQIGTVYRNDRFSAGIDMYYINFQNYIGAAVVPGSTLTTYTNNGSAVFKGIEFEGTVKIIDGVVIYGNATLNDADYQPSGFPVELNPRTTAAVGPIVQRDNFYGAFLVKYVGPQYTVQNPNPTSGGPGHPLFPIGGYTDADISIGYTLTLPQFDNRSLNFRGTVTNVFNDHSLIGAVSAAASGQALFATNPGRGVFISVSAAM